MINHSPISNISAFLRATKDDGMETKGYKKYDVLFGRGGGINFHPGNILFRRLIDRSKGIYKLADNFEKDCLVVSVIAAVESTAGGRFLQKVNCVWTDVSVERKRRKTAQAFRDALSMDEMNQSIRDDLLYLFTAPLADDQNEVDLDSYDVL